MKNILTPLYIGATVVVAAVVAALALQAWPVAKGLETLLLSIGLVAAIALAGRFPIKISRQADAVLVTLPMFMAVLLLHPSQAALVAATGVLLSEVLLKAPPRALIFNFAANGAAAGIAGAMFWALRPDVELITLTRATVAAALASGLALHAANVLLVTGMVTVRKGMAFWDSWKSTYAYEALQEGGLITLGMITALLYSLAEWSVALVALPCVLAYYGFRRNVGDAAEKARLAEELGQKLDELKRTQDQLVQSAKLAGIGTLAAGIAHEINNPIFVISAKSELALKYPDRFLQGKEAVNYATSIYEMSGRVTTIVRQLLAYARPASTELESVNLHDVVDRALILLGEKLRRGLITVERVFGTLPPVLGVSNQLEQVFVNLVDNAMDASPEGATIRIECRRTDSTVDVLVRDWGHGIPVELRDKLFDPFVTTKEVGKGTGLGLFICHKIIDAHGGKLTFETKEGLGTTFCVSLPCRPVVEQIAEPVAKPADYLEAILTAGRA